MPARHVRKALLATTACAVGVGGFVGVGAWSSEGASVPTAEAVLGVTTSPSASPSASPTASPTWSPSSPAQPGVGSAGTQGDGTGAGEQVSASGVSDLPEVARLAYERAVSSMRIAQPECGISWPLLAAIGRVESNHGRYGGSELGADGVSRPAIIGVPLDGAGPVAAIPDTDDGRLDGDTRWDRAVGAMQFIPSTWAIAGRDGDGDGEMNPGDIDDAALAAAAYLCPDSGSIAGDAAMRAAVLRYNHSSTYADVVLTYERGYAAGQTTSPGPTDTPEHSEQPSLPGPALPVATPAPAPATPTPAPDAPEPTPKPKPEPEGDAVLEPVVVGTTETIAVHPGPTRPPKPRPTTEDITGLLHRDEEENWLLGEVLLDLGPALALSEPAIEDYDGDTELETVLDELTGLEEAEEEITMTVRKRTTPALVITIGELLFREIDGSPVG